MAGCRVLTKSFILEGQPDFYQYTPKYEVRKFNFSLGFETMDISKITTAMHRLGLVGSRKGLTIKKIEVAYGNWSWWNIFHWTTGSVGTVLGAALLAYLGWRCYWNRRSTRSNNRNQGVTIEMSGMAGEKAPLNPNPLTPATEAFLLSPATQTKIMEFVRILAHEDEHKRVVGDGANFDLAPIDGIGPGCPRLHEHEQEEGRERNAKLRNVNYILLMCYNTISLQYYKLLEWKW